MDAYERLLSDAMVGDGTLFAGQDGVEAAWSIVQPILGNVTQKYEYEPSAWRPPEAAALAARHRRVALSELLDTTFQKYAKRDDCSRIVVSSQEKKDS